LWDVVHAAARPLLNEGQRAEGTREGGRNTLRPGVGTILGASLIAIGAVAEDAAPHKEIEMTASRFQFEPATVEVSEGDRVVLTLKSTDTAHGISIPEFKVKAKIPKGGEPVKVEFTASKAGSFPFECSEYCGSGHRKMKGRLVVAARAR
jgi:cytochrome c oxidase subunit II